MACAGRPLDPDRRPTGFYSPDVHPELFEQVDGEPCPRGPIAGAVPVIDANWQELLSHPGRRKLQGGRVVAAEPPALPPDADRALLREAMLRDQLEVWIEQRAKAPQGLSPEEIAALERLRARGPGALFKYEPKYDKAAGCLAKDRTALLAFYGFPAEH